MKSIGKAIDIAYRESGQDAYFGNGFKKGVEFAQRWIPIDEELPEENEKVFIKVEIGPLDRHVDYRTTIFRSGKFSNQGDWTTIVGWRPIERK